jgi:hypothetical protein
MNTKQNQIQKANKNNIEWRKILPITFISPLFLFFVAMLLLSTAPGRKIFDFFCKFGGPIVKYHCPSPAAGLLLIFIGTPITALILGAVTTKNKKFLHGILAGFLSGLLTCILFLLWGLLFHITYHPQIYTPQNYNPYTPNETQGSH